MKDVEVVKITPELAREWLGFNTHNRNLRFRVIRAYAADMAAGNWQWNGESIKFAKDGTLLDGQHRLAAIAESGTTLDMLVIRGLPNETQETVDGGAKRRFGDVLHLRGERDPLLLAAIIRRVVIWEISPQQGNVRGDYVPTNAQMLQALEQYPELRDLTRPVSAVHCALPGSIIGFCWWVFARCEDAASDVDFFFARLSDGQGLVKGDPIYELRRAADNSKTVRGERSERFLTAIIIKAWNAYRDGATVGLLTFRLGGARPEKFPVPH
jgi:hypothetical protein